MRNDIKFLETLIALLGSLKEMVQVQTHEALSEWSKACSKELIEGVDDYTKIIQDQLYKLYFWDFILEDDWARHWYYAFPDPYNWDDEEVNGDEC